MNKKQVGIFTLDTTLLDTNLKLVQEILSKVVVTRAEALWREDAIEYTAISDLFQETVMGGAIRHYKVVFGEKEIRDDDGSLVSIESTFVGFE